MRRASCDPGPGAQYRGLVQPLWDEAAAVRQVSLVRLAAEIARSVAAIGRIAVEGEVHDPRMRPSGYVFFTLRDRAAEVRVVVPRGSARRCRAVNGERVRVTGSLEWANDRGALNLRAEEVLPVGAGAVAALLAETRAALAAAGLLDRPRRPLPALPAVIGVVCGADAAVRRDIESVVADRFPGYPVHFEETTVSGPGAAVSIAGALAAVVRRPGVEVVVLARGGGDATSLLPWSDETLCRAVAACPLPTVSAIGHEGDRPLCDLVADLRCGTPSIAAAAVVPDRSGLSARLDATLAGARRCLDDRLAGAARSLAGIDVSAALTSSLGASASALAAAGRRLGDAHPRRRVEEGSRRLAALDWRRPFGEVLGRADGRVEASRRHLDALAPARVLRRGYAVVSGPGGAVVRSAAALSAGDRVTVKVADGGFTAAVEEVMV